MSCGGCGHAVHPARKCGATIGTRCLSLPGGAMACFMRAPGCPCAWRTCKCGLEVAVAALAGTGMVTAVVRGSAGQPGGTLAVGKDGYGGLAARELEAGEWRGVEHLEWPDHGKVAAKYMPAAGQERLL